MENKICPNTRMNNKCKDDDCCIDTYRIYDSCRYQECMSNLRIFLCGDGQEILDASSNVRVKSIKVVWTQITTDEVPFNRGYYEVNIRYYFYIELECCGPNSTITEIQGISMADKTVMLYGGEGNVTTFQSDIFNHFCMIPDCNPINATTSLPKVVVEVVDPISLKLIITEGLCTTYDNPDITLSSIPEQIRCCFQSKFCDFCGSKKLYITIGVFAVVRIERASQLVVPACDYCLPEEPCEIVSPYTDPCSLFKSLEFPIKEFYPSTSPTASSGSFDVRSAEVNAKIR